MAHPAFAVLETALRARKLDRTLTTTLAPLERADPSALAPSEVLVLDSCLHGGLPRGQLSELAGPCSSGRTTLLLQFIAAATQRGEIAALIDTCDRLDVASAEAAGIDLDRLLWVRGDAVSGLGTRGSGSGMPNSGAQDIGAGKSRIPALDVARDALSDSRRADPGSRIPASLDRVLDRGLKALNLVLQAGGFAVVAIDLAELPPGTLRRIPFTTWPRVQRVIEGSDTACVLVTPEPLARSAGGLTLSLAGRSTWAGISDRSRRLQGLDVRVRVVSPRKRIDGSVNVQAGSW